MEIISKETVTFENIVHNNCEYKRYENGFWVTIISDVQYECYNDELEKLYQERFNDD